MTNPAMPSRQNEPMLYFVIHRSAAGGEEVFECLSRFDAERLFNSYLRRGVAQTKGASVYSAPSRELFDAHRRQAVELVCAGVPRDTYDTPEWRERMANHPRCPSCRDLVDDPAYAHCPGCGAELPEEVGSR